MKRLRRIWPLVLCLLIASCFEGTKTGNSGTKTGNSDQIDIELRAVNAPTVAASDRGAEPAPLLTEDAQTSTFEIQMAVLSLRDVKLFLDDAMCSDFSDLEFEEPVSCQGAMVTVDGPLLIDLTSGDSIPSLADLTIPRAGYTQANMKLEPGDPVDGVVLEGGVLDGVSFYVEGEFTCAEGFSQCMGVHDFSGAFDFNRTIVFVGDPFTVDSETQALRLNLEVTDWFASLEITECIQQGDLAFEGDGSLILQDGGNPCNNLELDIRNAFSASAKFGGVVRE